MDVPSTPYAFPTKDEVADYLKTYTQRFDLPVELGVRVDGLERSDDGLLVTAGDRRIEADNIVVAMASYQIPPVPDFAAELSDDVVQLHTSYYRNPNQLQDGDALVVGADNSGAEIALDVADEHETSLSARDVGHVPFHIDSWVGHHPGVPFVMRVLFHRIVTTGTPFTVNRSAKESRIVKLNGETVGVVYG